MEGVWGPCVMDRVGPAADTGDPGDFNLLPPSLYAWWAFPITLLREALSMQADGSDPG